METAIIPSSPIPRCQEHEYHLSEAKTITFTDRFGDVVARQVCPHCFQYHQGRQVDAARACDCKNTFYIWVIKDTPAEVPIKAALQYLKYQQIWGTPSEEYAMAKHAVGQCCCWSDLPHW